MSLAAHLIQRQAENSRDALELYIETLERLLAEEIARRYATEYIHWVAKRYRSDDDEPSDELVLLREEFPNVLRASTLPYIHGFFEQYAIRLLLLLPDCQISAKENSRLRQELGRLSFPSVTDEDLARFADYRRIRDACAHNFGSVSARLFDPHKIADAAGRIPGVTFRPMFEDDPPDINKDLRHSGELSFGARFLKPALAFHFDLLRKIGTEVSALIA